MSKHNMCFKPCIYFHTPLFINLGLTVLFYLYFRPYHLWCYLIFALVYFIKVPTLCKGQQVDRDTVLCKTKQCSKHKHFIANWHSFTRTYQVLRKVRWHLNNNKYRSKHSWKSPTKLYFVVVYQYTYVCNQTVFQYHTLSTEASHIRNVFFQLLYQSIMLQDERIITHFGLCYQLLIYLTTSLKSVDTWCFSF